MTKQELRAGVFMLIAAGYISGYTSFELSRGARIAYDGWVNSKVMVAEK